MNAGTGLGGSLDDSKDVDAIVSSFLEELETLSKELQPTENTSAGSNPPAAEREPVAAGIGLRDEARESAAGRPSRSRRLIGQIAAVALVALALFLAGRLYFRPAAVNTAQPAPPPASSAKPGIPAPGRLNDTAHLLAGTPVKPESPMYSLSLTEPFQRHRRDMQAFWKRIRSGSLNAISGWRQENIPAGLERNPVIYPMSGADYLNAHAFFPHSGEYLLLALESPGAMPDLNLLSSNELQDSLSAIRQSVQSMASVNYLQSRSMREELSSSAFRGIVPLLLLFAAGLGHTVVDLVPVTIGPEGALIPDTGEDAPRQFRRVAGISVPGDHVRGIRIRFTEDAGGELKSLTYLQLELRDEIFGKGAPEGRFLAGLKNRNAILKSAVYLLHGSGYGRVREFIIGSSDLVIQDDSGIPYQYFAPSVWEEHLFGKYTRVQPLGTLKDPPQQPLLARRYGLSSRPLDFPYGYGVLRGKGQSNLMLFIKKK